MKAKDLIEHLEENPEAEVCLYLYDPDKGYYVSTGELACTQQHSNRILLYPGLTIDVSEQIYHSMGNCQKCGDVEKLKKVRFASGPEYLCESGGPNCWTSRRRD